MRNRKMMKIAVGAMAACLFLGAKAVWGAEDKELSIVCTNFPAYDFARQVTGDEDEVTMLLKPGAESHSYDPTPQDVLKIQEADLFVYVGGDSDEWVENILASMDQAPRTLKLMDQVETVPEELVEGMQPEKEEMEEETGEEAAAEGEGEMDEHVWTAPQNAEKIVAGLKEAIAQIDPQNRPRYEENARSYIRQIDEVDQEIRQVVDQGKRREIIVADRFPFRYFCEEFGLDYYAAFPGCSTDTEADAATVAFLIDKVKADHIPVVLHIELSNEKMCDAICEATGAKKALLNAVHNVSDEDFGRGATYVSLMRENVAVLREALS